MHDAFSETNNLPSAYAVYMALCITASNEQSDVFTINKNRIAFRAGLSIRSVAGVLDQFEAMGLIEVKRQEVQGSHLKGPSTYKLLKVQAENSSIGNGCISIGNGCISIGNGRLQSLIADKIEESEKKDVEEQREERDAAAAATPHEEAPPTEQEKSPSALPEVPAVLSSLPGFQESWADFQQMRRDIRKPLTTLAARRLLPKLAQRPGDAVAALEMAIENTWRGFMWEWFDDRPRSRGEYGNRQASGGANHRDSPQQPDEPTPSEIAAWVSNCERDGYAAKHGEWTTWDRLPSFAKEEFFRDRRTARAAA